MFLKIAVLIVLIRKLYSWVLVIKVYLRWQLISAHTIWIPSHTKTLFFSQVHLSALLVMFKASVKHVQPFPFILHGEGAWQSSALVEPGRNPHWQPWAGPSSQYSAEQKALLNSRSVSFYWWQKRWLETPALQAPWIWRPNCTGWQEILIISELRQFYQCDWITFLA